MNDDVAELLGLQCGVVSRKQLLAAGVEKHDVRRMLRRRDLTKLHDGVYVDRTGEPTWQQLAWGGVLYAWPAALCHQSALRAADGPGRTSGGSARRIHVAVERSRSLREPDGVVLHHLADLEHKAMWNRSPPRLRVEEAVVDLAAEARDEFDAIAHLANAIQARRTTTERLQAALAGRSRIARRALLSGVLTDLVEGTCSVLEHGYLTRVERAHGLPRGERQQPAWSGGRIYREVDYAEFGLVVELDGRLFHDNPVARDRDLDRDIDAMIGGRITPRVGWGQVFGRPCATARRVGALLRQRGWVGPLLACGRC